MCCKIFTYIPDGFIISFLKNRHYYKLLSLEKNPHSTAPYGFFKLYFTMQPPFFDQAESQIQHSRGVRAGAESYAACSPLSVSVSRPLPYLFATAIPIASIISPPIAPTSQIYLYPSFPMESSQLPQTI